MWGGGEINFTYCTVLLPQLQTMKDWQLLLMAAGIIAIEVVYTIPLLVLIHLNGDTQAVIDESRPPFTNVSTYSSIKLLSNV